MNHRSRLVTGSTALLAVAALSLPAAALCLPAAAAAVSAPAAVATAPARSAVPPGFVPASTAWTSTDDGWVLGFTPCSRGHRQRCGTLVHTTDGGATWTKATVPGGLHVSPRFRQVRIAFASGAGGPGVGLASDGTRLYMTTDSAETWQAASLPSSPSIGDIGLTDTAAYAIVGTGSTDAGTTALYSTPRGRSDWAPVPRVRTVGNGVNIDGGYDFDLRGHRGAVALGRIFVNTGYWHTDDGTHWTKQPAPCTTEQYPSVNWVGPHRTVVTCSYDPGMSKEFKDVRVSVDGGAFSTTSSAPIDLFTTGVGAQAARRPLIGATGAGVAWLYETFDGSTWQRVLQVDDELPFHDIQFTDAQHGFLVLGGSAFDRGAAYSTSDGGHTWKVLSLG